MDAPAVVKPVIVALAAIALVVAIVLLAGFLLPVEHTASARATIDAPPERLFAMLIDVERFSEWRTGVRQVEILGRQPLRWREKGRHGTIVFERLEADAGRRLVTKIADPSLPFGGTWTYELSPQTRGTLLTITERGDVYNPVFRVASRFVFGHTATIDSFLTDIARASRSSAPPRNR
jgi:uncharacterized protein YndB with AHSA1/START domain